MPQDLLVFLMGHCSLWHMRNLRRATVSTLEHQSTRNWKCHSLYLKPSDSDWSKDTRNMQADIQLILKRTTEALQCVHVCVAYKLYSHVLVLCHSSSSPTKHLRPFRNALHPSCFFFFFHRCCYNPPWLPHYLLSLSLSLFNPPPGFL